MNTEQTFDRLRDIPLYLLSPTSTITDKGHVLALIKSPRGDIEGYITLPLDYVAERLEA